MSYAVCRQRHEFAQGVKKSVCSGRRERTLGMCEIEQAGGVPRLVCSYTSVTNTYEKIVILSAAQQIKCLPFNHTWRKHEQIKRMGDKLSSQKSKKKKKKKKIRKMCHSCFHKLCVLERTGQQYGFQYCCLIRENNTTDLGTSSNKATTFQYRHLAEKVKIV